MDLTQRYKINKDRITYRTIDSEVVILNLENGNYYTINESAAVIWGALNNNKDLSETLELVKKEYFQNNEDEIQKDIKGFVNYLEKEKIIEKD